MTHICVGTLTIIGSDNSLSPGRRQAIIWTNAGILLIRPLGTNFGEIVIEILSFSFKKMRLKVSSAKWRPFCLGLNVLTNTGVFTIAPVPIKQSWRISVNVSHEFSSTDAITKIKQRMSKLYAYFMGYTWYFSVTSRPRTSGAPTRSLWPCVENRVWTRHSTSSHVTSPSCVM